MAAATSSSTSCMVVGRNPQWRYEGKMVRCSFESERKYAAFYGIPYAVAPVGLKRYQAPESLPQNSGAHTSIQSIPTYKANVLGKMSTQLTPPYYEGSADCLYLNIFLPKRPEDVEELLPVLVYIHGGGFSYGSNNPTDYPADSIVYHGLVFVTINYRLGLFGFLNTHTKDCPGNAGLKDQVKALEWIRDNIECFKGDPNNVTISGNSAGGTCVNLHLIAPASKDLFHKAIVQSGGIYASWGYRGHRRQVTQMLFSDREFRKSFFAEKESTKLQERACVLLENDVAERHPRTISPYFGPTAEKFANGAFVPEDIEEMMKKVDHDKPVMAGITKEEGIAYIMLSSVVDHRKCINDDLQFRQFLMDNLRWSEETAEKYVDEIRNKYFPKRFDVSNKKLYRCFAKLVRDINFRRFYDNFKFGPEKSVHKNLYVYRFDHLSDLCAVRLRNMRYFNEATHGDELTYLYCPTYIRNICKKVLGGGRQHDKTIRLVMNHMCSLWANFCKTGIPRSEFDPNKVEWRRHTEEDPCYLVINTKLKLVEKSLYKDEWDWLNTLVNGEPIVQSLPATPVVTKTKYFGYAAHN